MTRDDALREISEHGDASPDGFYVGDTAYYSWEIHYANGDGILRVWMTDPETYETVVYEWTLTPRLS